MAKITAFTVFLRVPVVGQLNLRVLVARCRQEDEREATLLAVVAALFDESQRVAVKAERCVYVGHSHHCM